MYLLVLCICLTPEFGQDLGEIVLSSYTLPFEMFLQPRPVLLAKPKEGIGWLLWSKGVCI